VTFFVSFYFVVKSALYKYNYSYLLPPSTHLEYPFPAFHFQSVYVFEDKVSFL
jgi:hypothetical protein